MKIKRYALAGTGSRGFEMFAQPFTQGHAETAELVALCDTNPLRLGSAAAETSGDPAGFTHFDEMVRKPIPTEQS